MVMGKASEKARVHIGRVGDALNREAVVAVVIAALDALMPAGKAIKRGARVVVKPNLTADTQAWREGIVTNPYTVEGVVRWAQSAGPAEVVIAEATACGLDNKQAFRVNGLEEVAARTGARIVDLYDEEFIAMPVANGMATKEIRVARRVVEADFVINVPTMKTHVATGVSLCMKNLKGVLPENEKRRSHFLGVNKFVADLNSIVKPHLSVIDATIAMEGDGPMQGEPVGLGLVIAGSDTVATDLVATRVMGLDPWTFKCFDYARKQDTGVWREEDITLTGLPIEEVRRPFLPASGPFPDLPGVTLVDGGACPGCLDGARIAMGRIRAAGLLDKLPPVTIVVGENGEVRGTNDIIIGRCLKRHRGKKHYVPGCPAQIFVIADELREMAGQYRLFGSKEQYLLEEGEVLEK
jgi:uncharacterized protein (DUF362 family)